MYLYNKIDYSLSAEYDDNIKSVSDHWVSDTDYHFVLKVAILISYTEYHIHCNEVGYFIQSIVVLSKI